MLSYRPSGVGARKFGLKTSPVDKKSREGSFAACGVVVVLIIPVIFREKPPLKDSSCSEFHRQG